MVTPDLDVVVVGGGPAGLATAIHASMRGCRVAVLERRGPAPQDKACGEGLMPDAVDELRGLGIDPNGLEGRPFRGIRFLQDGDCAEGLFPGQPGLGVRRPRLHEALMDRARARGVSVVTGTRVIGLSPVGVYTDDGLLRARFVVGADGLHSRVRHWAGLVAGPGRHRRFGVRRHYAVTPWTDVVEVHWADRAEASVTPVGDHCIGVALTSDGEARFDETIAQFPVLRERLAGAAAVSRDRGAGPMHQRTRGGVRGHVALVGDAAGYIDSLTGEGLALAFQCARSLGHALSRESLALYEHERRLATRRPALMTHLLLAAARRPWLRRRVVAGLAREPALFSLLLGIHGGQVPWQDLGLREPARLVWRLVRA